MRCTRCDHCFTPPERAGDARQTSRSVITSMKSQGWQKSGTAVIAAKAIGTVVLCIAAFAIPLWIFDGARRRADARRDKLAAIEAQYQRLIEKQTNRNPPQPAKPPVATQQAPQSSKNRDEFELQFRKLGIRKERTLRAIEEKEKQVAEAEEKADEASRIHMAVLRLRLDIASGIAKPQILTSPETARINEASAVKSLQLRREELQQLRANLRKIESEEDTLLQP